MKTEYIRLTPLGAVALFLSGLMVGAVGFCGLPGLAVAIMGLFVVRQDAMDRITEGTYTRRWCVWRRDSKRSEPEVSA